MITHMDKATAKSLSQKVERILREAFEAEGLAVKVNGSRYDPQAGTLTPRLTLSLPGAEQRAFALMAYQYGLEAEDFGREITVGGSTVRIVGLNPKARSMPLLVETRHGDKLKCGITPAILRSLGRS